MTYGLAVEGFDLVGGDRLPRTFIDVDRRDEPNVRVGESPVPLHATVTVQDVEVGQSYVLYRYAGVNSFPKGPDDFDVGYEYKVPQDQFSKLDINVFDVGTICGHDGAVYFN